MPAPLNIEQSSLFFISILKELDKKKIGQSIYKNEEYSSTKMIIPALARSII